MGRVLKTTTLWLWGGFLYYLIEVLWRGYSHPSMFVVGGICFLLIGGINNVLPWELGFLWQALIGAAAITMVEFVSGCILNLWLGLDVWDYSNLPLNLLGQICLPFCGLWILISAFGIWLDDWLRYKLFGGEKPHYKIL